MKLPKTNGSQVWSTALGAVLASVILIPLAMYAKAKIQAAAKV